MSTVVTTPSITPGDRLGMTVFLAVVLHAIVILGVTFEAEERPKPRYEAMEIILVQQKSEPPEEADYLAQANLVGGGEAEEKISPATPLPAPFPDPEPEVTAPPPLEQVPPPPAPTAELADLQELEPMQKPAPEVPLEQIAVETPEPAAIQEIEAPPEDHVAEAREEEPIEAEPEPVELAELDPVEQPPEPAVEPVEQEVAEVPAETRPLPSAASLLSNSLKIASLSAEVRRKVEAQANRPRRKFISASTREYRYASYMEAWRAKVERIGNLNYPEDARRQGLTGNLILDVALKPDGSVHEITIRRSSGNRVLDEAAVRIVNLAAPFAPFPEDIRRETDILHITRTWQFLHGQRFQ